MDNITLYAPCRAVDPWSWGSAYVTMDKALAESTVRQWALEDGMTYNPNTMSASTEGRLPMTHYVEIYTIPDRASLVVYELVQLVREGDKKRNALL